MVEKNAQNWLDKQYGTTADKKDKVKAIKLIDDSIDDDDELKLKGEIDVKGFKDLEEIDLNLAGELTNLKVSSCPNLKLIDVGKNKITKMILRNLPKLERLYFVWNDKMAEIDVTGSGNIKFVRCIGCSTKIIWKGDLDKVALWMSGLAEKESCPIPLKGIKDGVLKETASSLGVKKEDLEGKSSDEVKELIDKRVKSYNNDIGIYNLIIKGIGKSVTDNYGGEDLWKDIKEDAEVDKLLEQLQIEVPPKS